MSIMDLAHLEVFTPGNALTEVYLKSVIVNTLHQSQPVNQVSLSINGAVPKVTVIAQLETVLPLRSHVTSICWSGLPIEAKVTAKIKIV